jgi:translation initiation factor 2 subunit 3
MTEHIIYYSQVERNQPLAVLGMAGSVACGKSTLTKVITGVTTQKHSSELINNASIKLGYTNLKIYHDGEKYICNPKVVNDNYKLVKHLSISDAPGHNSYFASMISGSKFMNLCLFLISGINGIEPQTHQHIKVLKSLGTKNISMIITKCDQIKNSLAFNEIYDKVIDLLDEYYPCDEEHDNIEPPIIPISNTNQTNINDVIDYIMSIPYPDLNKDNRINKKSSLVILRTFDVNKPGYSIDRLVGATIGGALTQGNVMVNDLICILPGLKLSDNTYKPLITKIVTLRSDRDSLEIAIPGGFVAISTTLDPSLSKDDKLVGQVVLGISSKEELYDIRITNNIVIDNVVYFTDLRIAIDEIISGKY